MSIYGNFQVSFRGCAGAPSLRGGDSRFSSPVGIRSGRDYHQQQGTLKLVTFLISKGREEEPEDLMMEAEIEVEDESTGCGLLGS